MKTCGDSRRSCYDEVYVGVSVSFRVYIKSLDVRVVMRFYYYSRNGVRRETAPFMQRAPGGMCEGVGLGLEAVHVSTRISIET